MNHESVTAPGGGELAEGEAREGPVLLQDRDGGVLTLTLNRPRKLNALTVDLVDALTAALASVRDDGAIRCVVVTGAGRGFSAGADLNVSLAHPERDVRAVLQHHYAPLITTMRELEVPIVAAVNGVAAGAGMSIALAADLRIAAESASFLQAFARIGLVPDAGATWFLPRLVGLAKAAELAMLAEQIDAAEALRLGLVNQVVPDAELRPTVHRLAQRLAQGPRALGLIKRALHLSTTSDLNSQLRHEEDLQALAAASADSREGVRAFVEKRPARFTGR